MNKSDLALGFSMQLHTLEASITIILKLSRTFRKKFPLFLIARNPLSITYFDTSLSNLSESLDSFYLSGYLEINYETYFT